MRPLPTHPWPPSPEDRALILAALPDQDIELCPAVPGAGRVLALRSQPPFICDCAPVPDPANPGSLPAAIRWVLGEGPDTLGYTVADYMRDWMGATEVKYGVYFE